MNACLIGGGLKEPLLQTAMESVDSPSALIIPSACSTRGAFDRKIVSVQAMFKELGVQSEILHEFDQAPTVTELDQKFGKHEVIYTIGGNTLNLMRLLKEYGTDTYLHNAAQTNALLAGTSAGALFPFLGMFVNPSTKPELGGWDYEIHKGLGFINAISTPHADAIEATQAESRYERLLKIFNTSGFDFGFAIDNNAALHITGHVASVLRSDPSANVTVIQNTNEPQTHALTGLLDITELLSV